MKMSVREARAQFAAAVASAERGDPVIITRNGKPVAQIAPPPVVEPEETAEAFRARLDRARKKLGLDALPRDTRSADEQIEDHRVWRRDVLGPDRLDESPIDAR